jgi:hypothetical protein
MAANDGWLVLVLVMAVTTTVLGHTSWLSMPVVAGKPAKVQIRFTQAPDAVSKITAPGRLK